MICVKGLKGSKNEIWQVLGTKWRGSPWIGLPLHFFFLKKKRKDHEVFGFGFELFEQKKNGGGEGEDFVLYCFVLFCFVFQKVTKRLDGRRNFRDFAWLARRKALDVFG